ncbi:MAG: hypothetical protein ABJI60_19620 [Kangiellaceae bacterium]
MAVAQETIQLTPVLLTIAGAIGAALISWVTSLFTTKLALKHSRSQIWWDKKVQIYELLINTTDNVINLLNSAIVSLPESEKFDQSSQVENSEMCESMSFLAEATEKVGELKKSWNTAALYLSKETMGYIHLAQDSISEHSANTSLPEVSEKVKKSTVIAIHDSLLHSLQIYKKLNKSLIEVAPKDLEIN